MLNVTHRGTGQLDTPAGLADVAYALTVNRSTTTEDGYGHVQSRNVDFKTLLETGEPLSLLLESGARVHIALTTAAGERAVFATTEAIPDFLFRKAG